MGRAGWVACDNQCVSDAKPAQTDWNATAYLIQRQGVTASSVSMHAYDALNRGLELRMGEGKFAWIVTYRL